LNDNIKNGTTSFILLCLKLLKNSKSHKNNFKNLTIVMIVIYFSSDFQCMEPLGMESGEIHSDQITVSSQYSAIWSSERSRLNYPENGWTPGEDSVREWIQVKR